MRVPFLVLHGGDDTVTDPAISRHLAEVAPATDKTIHIYDGCWHALMFALPHETERVCRDIFAWLDQRV
jgi:alpha-beta hydrolase superfamily lysophospholipase